MSDPEVTDPRDPYKRPDIVTELDRYLALSPRRAVSVDALVRRARHEIVELRAFKDRVFADIRDEVLEEAAQKAEHYEAPIWSAMIAAAIRALKERP